MKKWRNWAIELLTLLALVEGCARVPLRPTSPKGVPIVGVAVVKGAKRIDISTKGPYRITIGKRSHLLEDATIWSVRFNKAKLRVELNGRRAVKDPALPITLVPEDGQSVLINGRPYHGRVKLRAGPGVGLTAVNILNLEDYLKGVVPCELGPVREPIFEAAKAQAIAARTYALNRIKGTSGSGYAVESTQADQVYGGIGAESELASRAVEETYGLVILYNGEPIEAKYSSTCGGHTADAVDCWGGKHLPYLRPIYDGEQGRSGRDEPFCKSSPHFRWTVRWKWRDFFTRIKKNLSRLTGKPVDEIGEVTSVRVKERDRSKRVRAIEVETTKGVHQVRLEAVRKLLRTSKGMLKSRAFHLHIQGDEVVAKGGGFGHGSGMCQWGAMEMAKRGYDFQDILKHYYRGANIRKIY